MTTFELMQNKKELPEDVKDRLLDLGFLTGSRAWGVHTEFSDVDVFFKPAHKDLYLDLLTNHEDCYLLPDNTDIDEDYEDGTVCLYVKHDCSVYNLIFCENAEVYTAWLYATQTIKSMLTERVIIRKLLKDRDYRVKLFKLLRQID